MGWPREPPWARDGEARGDGGCFSCRPPGAWLEAGHPFSRLCMDPTSGLVYYGAALRLSWTLDPYLGALVPVTARRRKSPSFLSFCLLSFALAAASCGGVEQAARGRDAHDLGTGAQRAGRVALTYQAVTSEPGAANWVVEQGPHGATIQQGGQLSWTPTAGQAGDQAFRSRPRSTGHGHAGFHGHGGQHCHQDVGARRSGEPERGQHRR